MVNREIKLLDVETQEIVDKIVAQTGRLAYAFIEDHNLEYYFELWIANRQKQTDDSPKEG